MKSSKDSEFVPWDSEYATKLAKQLKVGVPKFEGVKIIRVAPKSTKKGMYERKHLDSLTEWRQRTLYNNQKDGL